jgi:hypothetical protein
MYTCVTDVHTHSLIAVFHPQIGPQIRYANHGGGFTYHLCAQDSVESCRVTHLIEDLNEDAYFECIWSCFEATPLQFARGNTTHLQYRTEQETRVLMKEEISVVENPRNGLATEWVRNPISDTNDGTSTYDAVDAFLTSGAEAYFESDFPQNTGQNHWPQDWHITSALQLPPGVAEGEYLLGWRYDCGMADQIWSNCAALEVV